MKEARLILEALVEAWDETVEFDEFGARASHAVKWAKEWLEKPPVLIDPDEVSGFLKNIDDTWTAWRTEYETAQLVSYLRRCLEVE